MVCEACKQNRIKVIRDLWGKGIKTNIFLCEPCESSFLSEKAEVQIGGPK